MDSYFSDLRQRLELAIASGELTRDAIIEEKADKLMEIIGGDSLDLVELDMAMDEEGIEPRTVGALMKFLERGSDEADPPLVKK